MGEAVEDEEIKAGFPMETARTRQQLARGAPAPSQYSTNPFQMRSVHIAGLTFRGMRLREPGAQTAHL